MEVKKVCERCKVKEYWTVGFNAKYCEGCKRIVKKETWVRAYNKKKLALHQ